MLREETTKCKFWSQSSTFLQNVYSLLRKNWLGQQGNVVPFQPFLWVRAPSPCNLKTLGLEFLAALGARLGRQLTDVYLIWHAVRCQLIAQGVLIILIDEFR